MRRFNCGKSAMSSSAVPLRRREALSQREGAGDSQPTAPPVLAPSDGSARQRALAGLVAGDRKQRRAPWLVGALAVGVVAVTILSFAIGQYPVSPDSVVQILFQHFRGGGGSWPIEERTVVIEVRLPQILGALLIGAGLAASGAAYQTMLRNPLVSPEILGVTAGAGFGASLSILLGLPPATVQLLAFAGGLTAAVLALAISRVVASPSPTVLVLAGVVVGTTFAALISATQYFADPENTLAQITYWLFGSLDRVTAGGLIVPAVIVGVSLAALYTVRWKLTVLAAGEDEARTMGVNRRLVWAIVIGASTLTTATVVSIAGIIGWVGLIVPHIARSLVGPTFSSLLIVSCLIGGIFLLAVEDVSRTASTIDLPLGILTALIGGPFFVALLFRAGRQWV